MAFYPLMRPIVPDPYPGEFESVTDFVHETRPVLAREPDALEDAVRAKVSYIADEDYTVSFKMDGVARSVTVPRGMLTDLASVPRAAWGIVGAVGPHLEASIVHDYLYIAWQLFDGREPRKIDYEFANEVMYAGMDAADVSWSERTAFKDAFSGPGISWGVFKSRDDGLDGKSLFVDLSQQAAMRSAQKRCRQTELENERYA
ncbi:MAG: DUF1353 domain-containing protein [Alphaproteobacteria bacterium]